MNAGSDRPEAYLDPEVRISISALALLGDYAAVYRLLGLLALPALACLWLSARAHAPAPVPEGGSEATA